MEAIVPESPMSALPIILVAALACYAQFLTLMDDSFEARRMREWWPRMLE